MEFGGRGPDNPPINRAKPYDEVSKPTICPLISKNNDCNYRIFVLHGIGIVSISVIMSFFFLSPGYFIFEHANLTAEMLLTVVSLRGKDFAEIEPLKGIYHNKMYTVVGYTINQINWDVNGAYREPRSVKKDYYVQEEDGKLVVNTVYKEGNRFE